jgi:hypothetical protein
LLGLSQSAFETTSKSSFDPEILHGLQQQKSVCLFEYPTLQTEAVHGLATALKSARKSASLTDSNSPFVSLPEKPVPSAQAIYPAHPFSKLSPTFAPPMISKQSPLCLSHRLSGINPKPAEPHFRPKAPTLAIVPLPSQPLFAAHPPSALQEETPVGIPTFSPPHPSNPPPDRSPSSDPSHEMHVFSLEE